MAVQELIAWLAVGSTTEHQVQFGWFAVLIPVAGIALRAAVRGFTAEDRIREKCHAQIAQLRETVMTREIRNSLAIIAVKVHPRVNWPVGGLRGLVRGEPGDPESQAARAIGYWDADFAEPIAIVEKQMGNLREAVKVHNVLVRCAQQSAWAMAVFLPCWSYVGVDLLFPWIARPLFATIPVVLGLGASASWASCSWWFGNERSNFLSALVRDTPPLPAGTTQ